VGELTVLRDPDTGEVLDQSIESRGSIKVVKLKQKIAICKIIKGDGIERGMTVVLP
jgi:hypothetical protein